MPRLAVGQHFLSSAPASSLAQLSGVKLPVFQLIKPGTFCVCFGAGVVGGGQALPRWAWEPLSRLLPNATPIKTTLAGHLLPWAKELKATGGAAWHFAFSNSSGHSKPEPCKLMGL